MPEQAGQLNGLAPAEAEEQLRDWARTGLASDLELDTARLRDAAYDTVPVRDSAFADLSKQSTGPGRALFDGRGVLHVLVPRDDPHESRTIGLLIDQHRSDAGSAPQQVQVHRYQIRSGAQTIELISGKPAPTSEVQSAHGYVTMRVDEAKGLTDYLAKTRHLSWLEVRGSEIWAGGWNWPNAPGVPLDFEDVSVIQRGYLKPPSEPRPSFSLDPGPPETRNDIASGQPPGRRADPAAGRCAHTVLDGERATLSALQAELALHRHRQVRIDSHATNMTIRRSRGCSSRPKDLTGGYDQKSCSGWICAAAEPSCLGPVNPGWPSAPDETNGSALPEPLCTQVPQQWSRHCCVDWSANRLNRGYFSDQMARASSVKAAGSRWLGPTPSS